MMKINLVQMEAALLKHSENADLEKVGSLLEELSELHHSRVDEDGEGILGEQVGKPDEQT